MGDFIYLGEDKPEVSIGKNVSIGNDVIIGKNCKKLIIGFGSFIGNDVYIDVPEIETGEYTTIHKNCTLHGYKPMQIGHNCWIGQNCIIDSIAGTTIGNNVGIGAYSQLWSHIKFGDRLAGCRWNDARPLVVEDDCWFVGHCIVSPITAHKKSMLLVGGVVTKDMQENHIYAGSPAKDVTDKMGYQFDERDLTDIRRDFCQLYDDFLKESNLTKNDFPIDICDSMESEYCRNNTVFFLKDRMYIPQYSDMEFRFIKWLLYDKAKFIPTDII